MSKCKAPGAPDFEPLDHTVKDMLHLAEQAGAKHAEVFLLRSQNLSISVREGVTEEVESSESQDLGLRVLIGHKQACVSSSDLSRAGLQKMAERAVAMATLALDDPYCGLADPDQISDQNRDLDLFDPQELQLSDLSARALESEAAALNVSGINLPVTASASWSASTLCHRASNGLARQKMSSFHGNSVMCLAQRDDAMQRDWAQSNARWLSDLRSPNSIGQEAAARTIARLGAQKANGGKLPVLFEPRTAKSLIGMFLGAISGTSVARGVSFLKDKMNEQIFADGFDIYEDPFRLRGVNSANIDSEGIARTSRKLIDNGKLTGWIHNLSSARQLGEAPTGHGATGIGSPPGTRLSNVYVAAGEKSPEQLMQQAEGGILVTDAFGASFNGGTGDWSVGIAGFTIENGQRAQPIAEMTLAGNMIDIFKTLIPASDLKLDEGLETPTLLIPELAVAGQ